MSLSPNHGPRRDGQKPALIVLHYTAMRDCAAAEARLCDPAAEVSAHWLIDRSGRTIALVDEDRRAWHAGAGSWQGRGDVNSRSIGIELDNDGASPFPEPQMAALERLLRAIMARWDIPPLGVIGHSDMAPDRKVDPGPRFDWRRLARQGLSVWPAPAAPGDTAAQLTAFGFPPGPDQLAAFRLRFRPGATGPLSAEDRALAAGLDALRPPA
ncbi:N-acetylmuramoyl-L-alanine amidase [Falsirhodobacter algicola]|uniref:N-acetylmuramoyl-L-alanine amidase n=1 Tax=Falsirhodobacter algicola TaxID=2692330 RepID=A0A8J8MV75_9RHOB|nr:N-acetylmuramoyl-L-alanine amidase [Falsirhodobacter algicola]QUS37134.1 N-acetylmuramoyl-L-alanine amidase [Falsirhodobacter algicola]